MAETWNKRVSQSKWISVSERLPEAEKTVIWCAEDGHVFVEKIEKEESLDSFIQSMGMVVIAWQELPSPPTPNDY